MDRIWWDGDTTVAGGSEVVSFFPSMYLWYWAFLSFRLWVSLWRFLGRGYCADASWKCWRPSACDVSSFVSHLVTYTGAGVPMAA